MTEQPIIITTFKGSPIVDLTITGTERFEVRFGTPAYQDLNGIYESIEDVEKVALDVQSDEIRATLELDDNCYVISEKEIKRQILLAVRELAVRELQSEMTPNQLCDYCREGLMHAPDICISVRRNPGKEYPQAVREFVRWSTPKPNR